MGRIIGARWAPPYVPRQKQKRVDSVQGVKHKDEVGKAEIKCSVPGLHRAASTPAPPRSPRNAAVNTNQPHKGNHTQATGAAQLEQLDSSTLTHSTSWGSYKKRINWVANCLSTTRPISRHAHAAACR